VALVTRGLLTLSTIMSDEQQTFPSRIPNHIQTQATVHERFCLSNDPQAGFLDDEARVLTLPNNRN
jgi:hypothetical protein